MVRELGWVCMVCQLGWVCEVREPRFWRVEEEREEESQVLIGPMSFIV